MHFKTSPRQAPRPRLTLGGSQVGCPLLGVHEKFRFNVYDRNTNLLSAPRSASDKAAFVVSCLCSKHSCGGFEPVFPPRDTPVCSTSLACSVSFAPCHRHLATIPLRIAAAAVSSLGSHKGNPHPATSTEPPHIVGCDVGCLVCVGCRIGVNSESADAPAGPVRACS